MVPTTSEVLPETPKLDKANRYKYVGVAEGCDFLTQEVKKSAMKAYISWICKILTLGLTANKMMTTNCAFDILVLCNTFGIIKWTKTELQRLDKKARKLPTINSVLHLKSSVMHLYLHWLKQGRRLTGVEDTHTEECSALAKYVMCSTDPLT
eukprot:4207901-Ditylum_brightwellii.AAC.1